MTASSCPDPLIFQEFTRPEWSHAFFLREEVEMSLEDQLKSHGWDSDSAVQAEQTHGSAAAQVDATHRGQVITGVDALMTRTPGLVLAIRVADCAPIYLGDPVTGSIALIHSGKKGTALNILGEVVERLHSEFKVDPGHLLCMIGPCIRPPDYEVDIAAEIRGQAGDAGIQWVYDCGLNTAADLGRFYSYRAEKGNTGRHWAVLTLNSGSGT